MDTKAAIAAAVKASFAVFFFITAAINCLPPFQLN